MQGLQGRTAFVTGGTSGIGRRTALAFAEAGANVAIIGRSENEGRQVAAEVEALGARALFTLCDVTDAKQVDRAIDATVRAFGRLDCAVNSAGVEADGRLLTDADEALFDRIVSVNLKGTWLPMRAQLRAMLAAGGGAIVNVASVGGLVGFPQASVYAASKHAVVGLTRSAALEYAAAGVRVNCVAPGTVDTPMFERFGGADPAVRAQIEAMHPMGRLASAEEVAAAVLWLCSNAASFITGHALAVDGGYTAR